MTREDFETEYAWRHMKLSFMHNQADAVDAVRQQRDGDTYTDELIADEYKKYVSDSVEIDDFKTMDKYGLTFFELTMFNLLRKNIGKPVSRSAMCEAIGRASDYWVKRRFIDVHICNIKRKVSDDYEILTCRGVGYVMGKSNGQG